MTDLELSRFMNKVSVVGDCWNWLGWKNNCGYGSFWLRDNDYLAHRVSYEHYKKPIEKDMTIDHICLNKSCVNPEHLRELTKSENSRLGNYTCIENILVPKTHCKRGHEFTEDNLVKGAVGRMCRTCHNAYNREYSRKNWRKYQQKSTPIVAV